MSDDSEWRPPEEGPLFSRRMTEAEKANMLRLLLSPRSTPLGHELGGKLRAHFLAEDSMRAGCPDDLRAKGWTVAVHNDYEQGGERFTFWLMTKKGSNIALKGEGKTDAEALDQIREQIRAPDNVSRLRHWANGWWKGVHDLAAAVGATIDEDGEDVEGAASRLGGLLEAVGRRDDPSTWEQYKAAEVCECEQPDLRAGRCFSCGGAWFPDGNDEEP